VQPKRAISPVVKKQKKRRGKRPLRPDAPVIEAGPQPATPIAAPDPTPAAPAPSFTRTSTWLFLGTLAGGITLAGLLQWALS
jgi:hypothetical protein